MCKKSKKPSNVNRPVSNDVSIDDSSIATVGMKELSRSLKISTRTIQRMVKRCEVPEPLHIGRSVRWRIQDIDVWLNAKKGEKGDFAGESVGL